MTWDERYGPWALVTGASSGIGAEFVRQIASRGLNVILVARRKDRMDDLARSVETGYGIATRVLDIDLLAPDAVACVQQGAAGLDIGLLVNNAGFGLSGTFANQDARRQADMILLNCLLPVQLTQSFLPAMIERGRGGLIFQASTAAYQATPYLSAYGATKAFNLMLGESLSKEYREAGVDSLSLSPGFTSTEFADVADIDNAGLFRVATADAVVRAGLGAMGRKSSIVHGWLNKALTFSTRLLPRQVATAITAAALKGRAHNL